MSSYTLTGVLFLIYFLPTFLSVVKRRDLGVVFLMNLFLGWTIIGWFYTFAWSVSKTPAYLMNQKTN